MTRAAPGRLGTVCRMITDARVRRRRSCASLLALAVTTATVGVAAVGLAPPARSVSGVQFARLAGGDRYDTAAAIASETFGSASIALLVSGERFPDAVAASYLAGVSDAPVLLARRDAVPAATLATLQALGVGFVVVVGGTEALSPAVPAQLTAAGIPNARVAGGDRYQTASALASVTGAPTVGLNEDGRRTAILASGEAFPDALAAGPLAYDDAFPLLLTPPSALAPDAEQALATLGIQHVIVVGGTGAVSTAVTDRLTALGVTSERLAGGDRYATARAIAAKAIGELGHTAAHVDLATGDSFPDALAGGPHAGSAHGVIVLTPTAPAAPGDTDACGFLVEHAPQLTSGHVLGGVQAVAQATEDALEGCAAGTAGPGPGVDPNIDYPATPAVDSVATLDDDGVAFTWTFSGVTDVVDIALVPCFAVTRGAATTVADDAVPLDGAFPPDAQDRAVGRGPGDHLGVTHRSARQGLDPGARITGANGAIPPTTYVDGMLPPPGGTLAVTVTATAPDCTSPLVFADGVDDDRLDLGPDHRPTDRFGIGGAAVATLGDAPAERSTVDAEVLHLDEANDTVVLTDGYRYRWGAGSDRYFYGTFAITKDEFEIALSRLDRLDVDLLERRFVLRADVPGEVTGVTVTMGDFDGVASDTAANDAAVTWQGPDPTDGLIVDAQVDVYRCAPSCVLVRQVLDSDHEPASAIPPVNHDVDNDGLDDDVDRSVVVEDLPAGPYRFVVSAISHSGLRSIFGSVAAGPVDAAATAGSPRSIHAGATDGGFAGSLGPGDTLRVTFDQVMRAPDPGDTVHVRDEAGRPASLVHGGNATFFVTGDVLTIRVDAAVAGGTVTMTGLKATGSQGVTDPDGLEWDLPGSTDRTFD